MWTGDVQSDYPNSNWALNPSAYQNLPNEQVDWATLAQQWIRMKETLPVDQVPPAPPPPSIKADIEAGEAPMDMSKDDGSPGRNPDAPSQDSSGNWNNWSSWQQQQQWNNWGWGGSSDSTGDKSAGVPPYTYSATTGNTAYSADTTLPAAASFDYNHGTAAPDNYNQQNYWSAGGPGPYMRNKGSDWRGGKSASRSRHSSKPEETEVESSPVLDAAKRKQLPAWIREGLEKMEREKQRKMERDRQMMERERQLQQQKKEEEAALASGIPVKSKFETDSEESETEKEPEESAVKQRRSRFDTTVPTPAPAPLSLKPVPKSFSPPPVQHKTKEEIMQDVAQQMRYVLTDILMKVTNEEMYRVTEEVLTEMRAKAPATQLRKTPALTSLTGKLGLGIYDSDSDEDSAESNNEPTNGVDSDEELRERILRKKQEFSRIERDIEQMVELQEERERELVREQSESESESEEAKPQVETSAAPTGIRTGNKVEDLRILEIKTEPTSYESERQTPIKPYKTEQPPSETQTEDSDNSSSTKSESSSRSSSSSRRRKSKKSKKKKDRKSSKRKRKRSLSRSSDRRKSHRKSGRYEEQERRSRSRSRSRSRDRDHYRRHSNDSSRSHKRKHRSYSRDYSPDYHYRGKKSSRRSRD